MGMSDLFLTFPGLLILRTISKSKPNVEFPATFLDKNDVPERTWFRLAHWDSDHFFLFNYQSPNQTRVFVDDLPVAGTSFRNAEAHFLKHFQSPNFKLYLSKEPGNPHDKDAVQVRGTVDGIGGKSDFQVGYIPKDWSKEVNQLDKAFAAPYSVFLPHSDRSFGLRIVIFVPYSKRKSTNDKKKDNKT